MYKLIMLLLILSILTGCKTDHSQKYIKISANDISKEIYTGTSNYTESDVFELTGSVKEIKNVFNDTYVILDGNEYPDIYVYVCEKSKICINQDKTYTITCYYYKQMNEISIFKSI